MKLTTRLGVRRMLNSPFHYNDWDKRDQVVSTLRKENVFAHTAWEWSVFRHAYKSAKRRVSPLHLFVSLYD